MFHCPSINQRLEGYQLLGMHQSDVESTDIPQKLKIFHLKYSLQFASQSVSRQRTELCLSFLIVDLPYSELTSPKLP